MRIDLIVLVVLILITIMFFRKLSNAVYMICIADIFMRLIHVIANLLGIREFTKFVNKNIYGSIQAIINTYSSGIINTILTWIYVGIYTIFLCYVIRTFFRKKK